MEALAFDTGRREYQVGAGILRFNPTDPNLYSRFLEALEEVEALEKSLTQQPLSGQALLEEMTRADAAVKAILSRIFGADNDLEAVFQGVSLLAVASNGQRVLTNFLGALEPILSQGVRDCAAAQAAAL